MHELTGADIGEKARRIVQNLPRYPLTGHVIRTEAHFAAWRPDVCVVEVYWGGEGFLVYGQWGEVLTLMYKTDWKGHGVVECWHIASRKFDHAPRYLYSSHHGRPFQIHRIDADDEYVIVDYSHHGDRKIFRYRIG